MGNTLKSTSNLKISATVSPRNLRSLSRVSNTSDFSKRKFKVVKFKLPEKY